MNRTTNEVRCILAKRIGGLLVGTNARLVHQLFKANRLRNEFAWLLQPLDILSSLLSVRIENNIRHECLRDDEFYISWTFTTSELPNLTGTGRPISFDRLLTARSR